MQGTVCVFFCVLIGCVCLVIDCVSSIKGILLFLSIGICVFQSAHSFVSQWTGYRESTILGLCLYSSALSHSQPKYSHKALETWFSDCVWNHPHTILLYSAHFEKTAICSGVRNQSEHYRVHLLDLIMHYKNKYSLQPMYTSGTLSLQICWLIFKFWIYIYIYIYKYVLHIPRKISVMTINTLIFLVHRIKVIICDM